MTIRFWRRVRIIPGMRINLSKSGASLSIGRKGLWYTTGPRGQRVTIGAPGTGLFWWTRLPPHSPSASHPHAGRRWALAIVVTVVWIVALVALLWLGSIVAGLAATCDDGYARHQGPCAYHHGIGGYERHGYRYWDGPLSDEGTRRYGENGGTVHYGY